MTTVQELAPRALHAALGDPPPPVVLDVREPWERALCHLPDSLHIPLQSLPARVGELDPKRPTVVLCHHGVRSFQAARWLAQRGFAQVANLSGGIDGWAREVDPSMPVY